MLVHIKMEVDTERYLYNSYQNIMITKLPRFFLDFDITAVKMSLNNALFLNVFSCNTTIV